jgi:hypothetical protein
MVQMGQVLRNVIWVLFSSRMSQVDELVLMCSQPGCVTWVTNTIGGAMHDDGMKCFMWVAPLGAPDSQGPAHSRGSHLNTVMYHIPCGLTGGGEGERVSVCDTHTHRERERERGGEKERYRAQL